VLDNRVLRRILGPKRDKVTGDCRRLRNEELNDLFPLPTIGRVIKSRMRWARHVAYMGESCIQGLMGKPKRKKPHGRPMGG
jgi:hypothetical protein